MSLWKFWKFSGILENNSLFPQLRLQFILSWLPQSLMMIAWDSWRSSDNFIHRPVKIPNNGEFQPHYARSKDFIYVWLVIEYKPLCAWLLPLFPMKSTQIDFCVLPASQLHWWSWLTAISHVSEKFFIGVIKRLYSFITFCLQSSRKFNLELQRKKCKNQ